MTKTSIQFIKEAAKKLVNSKLQKLNAVKSQEIFKGVMQTVGLETLEEVYIFVAQFDLTCRDRISNMDDLSEYFECSSLDMLEYIPALKSLERKGILVRRHGQEQNIFKQNFAVNDAIINAIIENQTIKISQIKTTEVQIDKYEFCERITDAIDDDDLVTNDLILFTQKLENNNSYITFVNQLKKEVKNILDRILFYNLCQDNILYDGNGRLDLCDTMKNIYSSTSQRLKAKKSIIEEENILIKLGWVEYETDDDDDDDDEYIRLTEKGKNFFYGEDMVAISESYKCKDIYSYIKKLHNHFHNRRQYNSDEGIDRLSNNVNRTLFKMDQENEHIPEVARITQLIPNEFDRILFYTAANDMIEDEQTSLSYEIKTIYPREQRKSVLNELKNNSNSLQEKDLVEIEKSSSMFGEETNIILTDKGKELLLGEDAALYINDSISNKQILSHNKIVEKRLFFSKEMDEQLTFLYNSLNEKNYQNLCARLEDKKLPKGIAILLYGEPGTGKTESVMQIAKATGRDIVHVDISETKTCWFGESEKLIKKVFTDYKRVCEKSKIKPILLFNEADAVFSKRKDVNSSNVAQTENAIQNIILEEMEKLDGILIATTNLSENLDNAFERRFLFKIRFEKPTEEAKTNIWMNKLPSLSIEDAKTLACKYDFSGGQIDNIARKALMQEIIKGEKPTITNLITICGEEKISKSNRNKVGFN